MKRNNLVFSLFLGFGLFGILTLLLSNMPDPPNDLKNEETKNLKRQQKQDNYREFVRDNYRVYAMQMPDSISFAGEKVPLDNVDVHDRLDREFHVNTYWHSQTFLFHKRSGRWFPIIQKILEAEGLPDDFKYLCLIESGLDNVVSPAGAAGFWQIMKKTGKDYQLQIDDQVDERYHLEKSTKAACKYLKIAKKKFGSWTLAAASYNMGKAGLQKRLTEQKVESYYDLHLNNETSRYVMRIIAAKYILSESEYYGFRLRNEDLYQPYDVKKVKIESTIESLAEYAVKENTNYRTLKVLNPWLRGKSLIVKPGSRYEILLPLNGSKLKERILEDKE